MRKAVLLLTTLVSPFLASCAIIQVGQTSPKSVQNNSVHTNIAFENLSDGYSLPAKNWDKAETERQISGQTFLRNFPGKGNEILYFGADNIVYQWVSGNQSVSSSTWVIDFLSAKIGQSAKVYICTSLQNPASSHPEIKLTRRCIEPAMLFIPAAEHTQGDVFSLAGKSTAPGALTIERTNIDSLKKQFGLAQQGLPQ